MKRHLKALTFLLLFFITGCAVYISLAPIEKPLKEQLVEGKGAPKILIADVSGTITEGEKESLLSSKNFTAAMIKEVLQKAEEDSDVSGIILKINSNGGSVSASDTIYHEILKFKKKKNIPVYACVTDMGVSGAYYISMATDKVFSHPTSINGGIGVFVMKFNIEGLMSKIGVEGEIVKSGDKKDSWSPFRPSTPEEKEIFQKIIDELHSRFVSVIYEQRKNLLTKEEIQRLADGRVYTAEQAYKAKLIDRIGYLDDAIEEMKKALNIKEARIIRYYRPGTYKPTVYSSYPEGTEGINLSISVNDLSAFKGVRFMYIYLP